MRSAPCNHFRFLFIEKTSHRKIFPLRFVRFPILFVSLQVRNLNNNNMTDKEPGYVYILTNPSFREDWVKIGKSCRPVNVRSKELDNTAVPLPFEIFATLKTTKYNEAEKLVHKYIERFTNLRIRNNREFFNVKPEIALEIFKDVSLLLDDAEIDEVYKKDIEDVTSKESRSSHASDGKNKVWMIPCNQKFFDLKSCFAKYGEMYWAQYCNFHKGDIGYIYSSSPDSAIKYKVEIVEVELPYSPNMDYKEEFFVDKNDLASWKAHNRFALLRVIGTTNTSRLDLAHLLSHGMKIAPRGALNLSHKTFVELKKYVEENF